MLKKNHFFALLTVPLLSACGVAVQMTTPPGFVELEDQQPRFAYRATNAEGVVVAVRAMENRPRGDLSFWAAALDARLRRTATAESSDTVRSDRGLNGRQMRYVVSRNNRPHRYWATVFVTPEWVYVVEAAGDQSFFDQNIEEVQTTILSFGPG